MVFYGDLQSTTASATTVDATSVVADPGTFRIGGTTGTTFQSFRWSSVTVTGVDTTAAVVTTVTLSPAMPDTAYNVFLTPSNTSAGIFGCELDNKTTTSFDIRLRKRLVTGASTVVVDWIVIDF